MSEESNVGVEALYLSRVFFRFKRDGQEGAWVFLGLHIRGLIHVTQPGIDRLLFQLNTGELTTPLEGHFLNHLSPGQPGWNTFVEKVAPHLELLQ